MKRWELTGVLSKWMFVPIIITVLLLAVLWLSLPVWAEDLPVINFQQEYTGSFSKGDQLADYILDVPGDGLIQLDIWCSTPETRARVSLASIGSGPSYQEHKFISGTGFGMRNQPFDVGFGGGLMVQAGPQVEKVYDSVVFTLTAGRYLLTVSSWDKACEFKFKVSYTPARWSGDSEPNDTPEQAVPVVTGAWQSGHLAYNTDQYQDKQKDKVDYFTFSLSSDTEVVLEYGDDDYLGARLSICDQSGNPLAGDVYDSAGKVLERGMTAFDTPIISRPYVYVPPEKCSDTVRAARVSLKAGRYYLKVEEARNVGGAYRFRLTELPQKPAVTLPPVQQPQPPAPGSSPTQQPRPQSGYGTSVSSGSIRILVNNVPVQPDVPPQIINNRTMVPVRFVAQALHCQVEWNEATRTVVITSPGRQRATPPLNNSGQIRILVDGRMIQPDVPPLLINNRTMVPVRFVAEALGARVEWNQAEQTVIITSEDKTVGSGSESGNSTVVNAPLVGPYIDPDTQILLEKSLDASGREVFVPTNRSQLPITAGMPVINASVLLENALAGQKIKAALVYNHGQASLTSEELVLPKSGSGYIGFSFTRSSDLWPAGPYEIIIYLDGVRKASTPFEVVPEDGSDALGG